MIWLILQLLPVLVNSLKNKHEEQIACVSLFIRQFIKTCSASSVRSLADKHNNLATQQIPIYNITFILLLFFS